jgi:hypothetical protein
MKVFIICIIVVFVGLFVIAGALFLIGMNIVGLNQARNANNDTARIDIVTQINSEFQAYVATHNNQYPPDGSTVTNPLIPSFINPANCNGTGKTVTSISVNGKCIVLDGLVWAQPDNFITGCSNHVPSQGHDFELCYTVPTGNSSYKLGTWVSDLNKTPYLIHQ